MFESALVPVSFREPVERVEALIGFLGNFGTRAVVLVHVVSSGLERGGQARRRLEAIAERVASQNHRTECVVRTGSPALEICTVARERRMQFICIPWKRKDFLKRSVLGSTTQDVARLTDVPLFVYKYRGTGQENGRLDNVLYSTTFDPSQDRVVPFLRYEGLTARTLIVLHVGWRAPDPETERARRGTIAHQLNKLKAECESCFEAVTSITEVGNPKRRILQAARRNDVDLIVLGKHEQGRALENVLGSTAERIIHQSKASVLIVPAYELDRLDREAARQLSGDRDADEITPC